MEYITIHTSYEIHYDSYRMMRIHYNPYFSMGVKIYTNSYFSQRVVIHYNSFFFRDKVAKLSTISKNKLGIVL